MEDALIRRIALAMTAAAVLGLLGFFLFGLAAGDCSHRAPDPGKLPG